MIIPWARRLVPRNRSGSARFSLGVHSHSGLGYHVASDQFKALPVMLEDIQGQIERITFHNEENGFTIARLKVKGYRELVTAVGNLMAPVPGQLPVSPGSMQHIPNSERGSRFTHRTPVPMPSLASYVLP